MKLATYKDGSRNGQLVVVSRDLSTAHYATGVAHTLQQVLDDWNFMAPQLHDLSVELNHGKGRHVFPFDPAMCLAPLPRAFQWVSGAACGSHLEALREAHVMPARTALPKGKAPAVLWQLASDHLCGAQAPLVAPAPVSGLDCESGLAAVVGPVPAGSSPARALESIRLLMLVNSPVLRELQALEAAWGVGAVQSRLASAFSPVAITPDELGDNWSQGRVQCSLHTTLNGRQLGLGAVGPDMTLHFGQLVAQVAATRHLGAGCVVGTGPVSHASTVVDGERRWPHGSHCIAEQRAIETLQHGQAVTGYLQFGDVWGVDMKGSNGHSLFGAIAQRVEELATE